MPEAMDKRYAGEKRNLQKEAVKKFPRDKERQHRYVFGKLYEDGWRPAQR